MRKLSLHMTTTIDGFIANPDGTLWDAFPWPQEMQEFTNDFFRRVDTAIYGRLTYEAIVPWWHNVAIGNAPPDAEITESEIEFANILEGITKIVFSRPMRARSRNVVTIDGDATANVAKLKEQPGGEIVLHGGARLVAELAQAGLIDEYLLFVSPAVVGAGKTLFSGIEREVRLRLLETRVLNSSFTLLRYAGATIG